MLIANTNYDPARMETCVRRMLQRKVDGVAILTSEMDRAPDRRIQQPRDIPLVFLDTGVPGEGISNIALDYAAGVDAAVAASFRPRPFRHRLHPRSDEPDLGAYPPPGLHRQPEAKKTTSRPAFIEEGDHRMDGGHDAMARLLARQYRPTAILASNDMTAIGAMGAIFELGLRVPEDISVIGFDDIDLSTFTQPPLTTVRVSRTEIARTAFRALYRPKHDAPPQGAEFTIHPTLVERKSTGQMVPQAARNAGTQPIAAFAFQGGDSATESPRR